jgi:hypothetical protein
MKTSLALFLASAGTMSASANDAAVHASKSGKSSKGSVCARRQALAFAAIDGGAGLIQDFWNDKGIDPSTITSPGDVDALCEFNSHASPNQGCWALYTSINKDGEPEYISSSDYFGPGNNAAKAVYESIDEYCECLKGYEDGCIAEAPYLEPPNNEKKEGFFVSQVVSGEYNTPAQYLDYCVFAGVTNGDFKGASLSKSAEKCGCFWVDAVEEEIDNCAGVELGDFDT